MNILILLAAGKGKRFDKKNKKQYIFINEKPLICLSLDTFISTKKLKKMILVIGKGDEKLKAIKYIKNKYKNLLEKDILNIIVGGKERYDSVKNALDFIDEKIVNKKDIKVIIHDGARPLIKKEDINNLIKALDKYKAISLASKEVNTIKIAKPYENDILRVEKTIDRDTVFNILTPQGFDFNIIYEAYKNFKKRKMKIKITDDLQMIENFTKEKAYLILGDKDNIKITTKEDLKNLK